MKTSATLYFRTLSKMALFVGALTGLSNARACPVGNSLVGLDLSRVPVSGVVGETLSATVVGVFSKPDCAKTGDYTRSIRIEAFDGANRRLAQKLFTIPAPKEALVLSFPAGAAPQNIRVLASLLVTVGGTTSVLKSQSASLRVLALQSGSLVRLAKVLVPERKYYRCELQFIEMGYCGMAYASKVIKEISGKKVDKRSPEYQAAAAECRLKMIADVEAQGCANFVKAGSCPFPQTVLDRKKKLANSDEPSSFVNLYGERAYMEIGETTDSRSLSLNMDMELRRAFAGSSADVNNAFVPLEEIDVCSDEQVSKYGQKISDTLITMKRESVVREGVENLDFAKVGSPMEGVVQLDQTMGRLLRTPMTTQEVNSLNSARLCLSDDPNDKWVLNQPRDISDLIDLPDGTKRHANCGFSRAEARGQVIFDLIALRGDLVLEGNGEGRKREDRPKLLDLVNSFRMVP